MAAAASPEEMLPLTTTVFHILLVLAETRRHGYGIMKAVEAVTEEQVVIGPGTLYGAVKRMLDANLIEESDERPDPEMDDERRRYYQLTPFGRQVLEAEVERLAHLVRFARSKQLLEGTA